MWWDFHQSHKYKWTQYFYAEKTQTVAIFQVMVEKVNNTRLEWGVSKQSPSEWSKNGDVV